MARPRYPSDLARLKNEPHVRVALRVSNSTRTAEVWAEPEARGMLVELWRIAAQNFAGRRGGEVVLTRSDLASIAGRTHHRFNLDAVRILCGRVAYPVRILDASEACRGRVRGVSMVVTIENFNKHQGYDSANDGVARRSTSASEVRGPKAEGRSPKTEDPVGTEGEAGRVEDFDSSGDARPGGPGPLSGPAAGLRGVDGITAAAQRRLEARRRRERYA